MRNAFWLLVPFLGALLLLGFCSGGPIHRFHKVTGSDVIAADMNNDGIVDLVVARSPEINILLKDKRGHLAKPVAHVMEPGLYAKLLIQDLNGDSLPDVVASTGQIFLADGDGFTAAKTKLPEVTKWVASDVNKDGEVDLVSTKLYMDREGLVQPHVIIITNLGRVLAGDDPHVRKIVKLDAVPTDLLLADFDRDGDPDIAVLTATDTEKLKILENRLEAKEGFPKAQTYEVGAAHKLTSADLNGDSQPDLVLLSPTESECKVLTGQGGLKFEVKPGFKTPGSPQGLDFGNLNGDQHVDIALVCAATKAGKVNKEMVLLEGNSTGRFEEFDRWSVHPRPTHVLVLDLDGQGADDVAVLSEENELESFVQKS